MQAHKESQQDSGLMAFLKISRAQRETQSEAQPSAPPLGHSATAPGGAQSAGSGAGGQQLELFTLTFEEQLDLFFDRAPAWPHVSTDLQAHGAWRVDREHARNAMEYRAIQHNPGRLVGGIALDLDYEEAPARVLDLARGRYIPAPNIITANPDEKGAHAVWLLEHPVARSEAASQKPLRWLAALEAELTERTEADRGYSGFLTKHPRFIGFATMPGGASNLYTLAGLEAGLGGSVPRLTTHRALVEKGTATGRNCYIFDTVRRRAYTLRRSWFGREGERGAFEQFSTQVYAMAMALNSGSVAGLWACGALSESEVRATAKSISKWTWANMTGAEFSRIQAERGRRATNQKALGAARSAAVMDKFTKFFEGAA